jgi:hypothetical protein
MKDVLNAVVQAVGDQAIALGTVADRIAALKQWMAGQFPDLADDLKGQVAEEQEQSRKQVYELQVSLAKLREAIEAVPEVHAEIARPQVPAEKKRAPQVRKKAAGKLIQSQQVSK